MHTPNPILLKFSSAIDFQAYFLNRPTDEILRMIAKLLHQLNPDTREPILHPSDIESFFSHQEHLFLLVIRGKIIGMVTLVPMSDFVCGHGGYIDNLVIHKDHRGRHYSRLLMNAVVSTATSLKMNWLELDSLSHRVEAHGLYESMGFDMRTTNVFELNLSRSTRI